jgi:hypothetical protein
LGRSPRDSGADQECHHPSGRRVGTAAWRRSAGTPAVFGGRAAAKGGDVRWADWGGGTTRADGGIGSRRSVRPAPRLRRAPHADGLTRAVSPAAGKAPGTQARGAARVRRAAAFGIRARAAVCWRAAVTIGGRACLGAGVRPARAGSAVDEGTGRLAHSARTPIPRGAGMVALATVKDIRSRIDAPRATARRAVRAEAKTTGAHQAARAVAAGTVAGVGAALATGAGGYAPSIGCRGLAQAADARGAGLTSRAANAAMGFVNANVDAGSGA